MDQEHVIEEFTYRFPVPKLDAKSKCRDCYNCGDRLKLRKQHHCKLCGHMFCPSCTSKYYIPREFDLKKHEGEASRVCMGCYELCLQSRQERIGDVLTLRRQGLNMTKVRDVVYIHPPSFLAPLGHFDSCGVCGKSSPEKFYCRACGDVSCSDCIFESAVEFPMHFGRNMNMESCKLICKLCRFRVRGGAKLVDSFPLDSQPLYGLKSIPLPNSTPTRKSPSKHATIEQISSQHSQRYSTTRSSDASHQAYKRAPQAPMKLPQRHTVQKSIAKLNESNSDLVSELHATRRRSSFKVSDRSSIISRGSVFSPEVERVEESIAFTGTRSLKMVSVKWYGMQENLMTLDITNGNSSLASAANQIRAHISNLSDSNIAFVYHDTVIPTTLWPIIDTKYMGNSISIVLDQE